MVVFIPQHLVKSIFRKAFKKFRRICHKKIIQNYKNQQHKESIEVKKNYTRCLALNNLMDEQTFLKHFKTMGCQGQLGTCLMCQRLGGQHCPAPKSFWKCKLLHQQEMAPSVNVIWGAIYPGIEYVLGHINELSHMNLVTTYLVTWNMKYIAIWNIYDLLQKILSACTAFKLESSFHRELGMKRRKYFGKEN